MQNPELRSICENADGTIKMAIGEGGKLMMAKAPEFNFFDRNFNVEYRYYFKECIFTVCAWCGDKFVAAGMEATEGEEDEYRCVVYSSENGGVFKQEILSAAMTEGVFVPVRKINSICYDDETKQVFLAGNGGQIITLTKSPQCTKVKYLANKDIINAKITKGNALSKNYEIEYSDHSVTIMSLNDVIQPRVDVDEAKRFLEEGAVFIHVFEEGDADEKSNRQNSQRLYGKKAKEINKENLGKSLKDYSKDTCMVFVEDRYASYARNCGFKKAYSVTL